MNATAEINESRLAQLRHRFWKYLPWVKRNEVLVAAHMIPATSNNPIPQTIEMTVINAAPPHHIRKLWEEVMKLIPSDQRTECP